MTTVSEALGGAVVGSVESVSADGIRVLLHLDAPSGTALNTGIPRGFPRINSIVLVPHEVGATVCQVEAVRFERYPTPDGIAGRNRDLVALPVPQRVIFVVPIATLVALPAIEDNDPSYEVRRGVDCFPSVGDPVLLPSGPQLRAVVEGENGKLGRRILIGTAPMAGRAPVYVDPNKLFGRHLAVLGNTGSGKSCSVAGLIRWCLEASAEARVDAGKPADPNARFIVLDPNGEYANSFGGLGCRLFQVDPETEGTNRLTVPAWLWNGEEWAAFTNASKGVQRPLLMDALRHLRAGFDTPTPFDAELRSNVQTFRLDIRKRVDACEHRSGPWPKEHFASSLVEMASALRRAASQGECPQERVKPALLSMAARAESLEVGARGSGMKNDHTPWHEAFPVEDTWTFLTELDALAGLLGIADTGGPGEDAPVPFVVNSVPGYVDALASSSSSRDLGPFIDTLTLRIRGLLSRGRMSSVANPDHAPSLEEWLTEIVGSDGATNGRVAVLDLSLVPTEIIHLIVAVVARIVFEATQRYRRTTKETLPTVLVLEEAHSFVHRDFLGEFAPPVARACCSVIERIAREGRKFGLGLVLSSQRPSELSATALSQCNTFLLHRIVNDQDQGLVRRFVPDGVGGLLRELPSLPARRAILLGWAAPAPVVVEMNELPVEHRPRSPDPEFWEVWTGEQERPIDWSSIAGDWRGRAVPPVQEDEATVDSSDEPPLDDTPQSGFDDDIPF